MKILVVTHYWSPHHGGIEVVATEQVRRLTAKGHEVTVVTSNVGQENFYEKIDGYSVYRIPALNILENLGIPYPIFSWNIFSVLKCILQKHDVIMVHGHSYIGSYIGALLAKRFKKPLLVLQHNQFVEYPFPWGLIERIVDKTIGRYTLSRASAILATSEVTRSYAEDLVDDIDVVLLPNGVDMERFTPAKCNVIEKNLRHHFGLSENDFIVLTVRRLVYRNGLDVLLSACSQLIEHHDVKCLIGGTGPELPNLQRIAEEKNLKNVKFLGNIPDDKLPEYYKIADLFTLPTRSGEGFGLVLLEAFASALPVIATRSGGPEEIIDHGINGLLISVDSANELASGIIKLKMDNLMVEQMKKHAFCKSRKFSWDNNASILEKKLLELVI